LTCVCASLSWLSVCMAAVYSMHYMSMQTSSCPLPSRLPSMTFSSFSFLSLLTFFLQQREGRLSFLHSSCPPSPPTCTRMQRATTRRALNSRIAADATPTVSGILVGGCQLPSNNYLHDSLALNSVRRSLNAAPHYANLLHLLPTSLATTPLFHNRTSRGRAVIHSPSTLDSEDGASPAFTTEYAELARPLRRLTSRILP